MADDDKRSLTRAAGLLQSRYREHRNSRESSGLNLSSPAKRLRRDDGPTETAGDEGEATKMSGDERWKLALTEQEDAEALQAQSDGHNDPTSRWRRGGFYAGRLAETPGQAQQKTSGLQRAPSTKPMEARYWLEMVDQKHRYGSNLKYYHARWNEEDTSDAFFKWLDEGAGKNLDLPECSREKLEAERITYLNTEQRRNYLVDVKDGLLVWARNGRRIDTARNRHRDAGKGKGIIDIGGPEDEEPEEGQDTIAKVKDKLMKRSSKHNIWIYAMTAGNKSFYIGKKQKGVFQHSSLVYGSQVLSAGELKVRDGKLTSLTALSGHFRTGREHFDNFVSELRTKGVNMHHVSIVKAKGVVGAMEKYSKAHRKKKGLVGEMKEKLKLSSNSEEAEGEEEEESSGVGSKDEEANRLEMGNAEDGRDTEHERPADLPDVSTSLPHDGREQSDMDEKERYERGIALMRKAMSRGLTKQSGGEEEK